MGEGPSRSEVKCQQAVTATAQRHFLFSPRHIIRRQRCRICRIYSLGENRSRRVPGPVRPCPHPRPRSCLEPAPGDKGPSSHPWERSCRQAIPLPLSPLSFVPSGQNLSLMVTALTLHTSPVCPLTFKQLACEGDSGKPRKGRQGGRGRASPELAVPANRGRTHRLGKVPTRSWKGWRPGMHDQVRSSPPPQFPLPGARMEDAQGYAEGGPRRGRAASVRGRRRPPCRRRDQQPPGAGPGSEGGKGETQ